MPDANDTNHEPENFGDLPIQPTGSGVADLEIAYEQMRLAGDDGSVAGAPLGAGVADETAAHDTATMPTEDTKDAADSAAHPS